MYTYSTEIDFRFDHKMMTNNQIDYTKYFSVAVLPKIHGEPDYVQLKNIKDSLKTNASRVTSELGGSAHSHLVLVLSPGDYALVSPVPYICPVHPGPIVIPPGTTQHVAISLRDAHKKEVSLFHQTVDLENSLKK